MSRPLDSYDYKMQAICKDFLDEFKPVLAIAGLKQVIAIPISMAVNKYFALRAAGISGKDSLAAFELEIEMAKEYNKVHLKFAQSPVGQATAKAFKNL